MRLRLRWFSLCECLHYSYVSFPRRKPKIRNWSYGMNWFCCVAFNSQMFNATEVQLWKWCFHFKFLFLMRPIHVWRSRTPDGVRCAHFPTVITTIMDQKVQLLKPLYKRSRTEVCVCACDGVISNCHLFSFPHAGQNIFHPGDKPRPHC
jgi:hypothetical protein